MTDEITFHEEADLPTVIVDAPGSKTPIGFIVWLDKSAQPAFRFAVKVRDENRDQVLIAHFRVLSQGNDAPRFFSQPVPTSADGVLRDLDFDVKSESLSPGECHRLELAVSGQFFNGTDPVFFDAVPPGRELDVAYASWTIWEGPGAMHATVPDKARLVETCGALEDLLTPAIVGETP